MNAYIGVGKDEIHTQHRAVMGREPGVWDYVDEFVRRPGTVPTDGAALAFRDNSLRAVYASHILEHFPHRDTGRRGRGLRLWPASCTPPSLPRGAA